MPADANIPCHSDPYPFDEVLDAHLNSKHYFRAVKMAKDVCGGCDFQAACLRENATEPGVVAGMTEAERKKLRSEAVA